MVYRMELSRKLLLQLEAERKTPKTGWTIPRKKFTQNDDGSWKLEASVADWFYYINRVTIVVAADGQVENCWCNCDAAEVWCRHCRQVLLQCPELEIAEDVVEAEEPEKLPAVPEEAAEPAESTESLSPFDDWYGRLMRSHAGAADSAENVVRDELDEPIEGESIEDEPIENEPIGDEPTGEEPIEDEPAFKEPQTMEICFGTDAATDEPVYWHPNDTEQVFHTNTGIIGTMGTGKTQFTKSLITQLHRNQAKNYDGRPLGLLIFEATPHNAKLAKV